ncbi:MAG: DUF1540 domain-containing protein [Candidatus Paraimprobicoccus trichonymphae]|uniref:DUF1540 domain-containing protein n=1 Tax=Candidatus Paraimprobicoccus trichonymphae TaxID=3033793 RepID=A0AA48HWT6_9FIRM|nr:MAG: DUF1540 domain-containing protein [Candidatus Paraimprobicoccus trichonymphae]
MGDNFNENIKCSVQECKLRCSAKDCCILDNIEIGEQETNATTCECTNCESFEYLKDI